MARSLTFNPEELMESENPRTRELGARYSALLDQLSALTDELMDHLSLPDFDATMDA